MRTIPTDIGFANKSSNSPIFTTGWSPMPSHVTARRPSANHGYAGHQQGSSVRYLETHYSISDHDGGCVSMFCIGGEAISTNLKTHKTIEVAGK